MELEYLSLNKETNDFWSFASYDRLYILTSTLLQVTWKVSCSLAAYRGYG